MTYTPIHRDFCSVPVHYSNFTNLNKFKQRQSKTSPCATAWNDIYKVQATLLGFSPKQELMKPYHMQPVLPSSQRPRTLDAKLRLVPHTHTSMSLTLMFSSSMFTGVLSGLNLQKSTKTTKLFKKPKIIIKPKKTESATKPSGESFCT